jgi:predicted SprT family Zn-dependent metalloprotease
MFSYIQTVWYERGSQSKNWVWLINKHDSLTPTATHNKKLKIVTNEKAKHFNYFCQMCSVK